MERCTFKGPIASAVAYEIERIARAESRGEKIYGEGTAYKAAFDRIGSSAANHVRAAGRDRLMSDCAANKPGGSWPRLQRQAIELTQ